MPGSLVVPVEGKGRFIAREYRRCGEPWIDPHARSIELFNRLGDAGSADFSRSATDRSHFSGKGARAIARLVVDALPQAEPRLRPYLKQVRLPR